MCQSGVYQIILKQDGRSYIGSSANIQARWKNHISNAVNAQLKSKQVISHAINKYGKDNFEWIILETCPKNSLIEREQYWLDKIQPFAKTGAGFNVREVADSNLGIIPTIITRKKMSKASKGVPKTIAHRENMKKVWHNNRGEEYYKQLSTRIIGDKNPAKRPEVAEKISKSRMGQTWADDTERVERHRQARIGVTRSPESLERMKIAQQKNNTRSEAAKENFYLAQRTLYEVTKPDQSTFQIYSRELKEYCKSNGLQYANLITTAKTGKVYKKGWKVCVLS